MPLKYADHASLTMRAIILGLSCMACSGYARRLIKMKGQNDSHESHETPQTLDNVGGSSQGESSFKRSVPEWQVASRNVLETLALLYVALGGTAFQCALHNPSGSASTGQLSNLATRYPTAAGRSSAAAVMQGETGTGDVVKERVGSGEEQQVGGKVARGINELLDAMPPEGIKIPASRAQGMIELIESGGSQDLHANGRDNTHKEELLKFESVLETLKADIPMILHEEPKWDIFADDFQVIDRKHAKHQGLGANQLLLRLLHRTCKELAVRDDVHVEDEHEIIVSPSTIEPLNPILVVDGAEVEAKWKVVLEVLKNPLRAHFGFPRQYSRIDIEAHTVFHLNDDRQVDYVHINKWLANGHEVHSWPKVHLTDDHAHNLNRIRDWLKKMQTPKPVNPELQRFRHMKNTNLRNPFLTSSTLVGKHAPDFDIELIGGEKKKLSAVIAEGKPIVLDFYMNF